MTQLCLKLHQPWAQGNLEAGALATVQQVADANGHVKKNGYRMEKPIPAEGGGLQVPPTVFDLPGEGYYEVEINRPRGQDIFREFFVKENEVRTETITLEGSPHEYLGWQQFAGIVSPRQTIKALGMFGSGTFEAGEAIPSVPVVCTATVPGSVAAWTRIEEAARGKGHEWARGISHEWMSDVDRNFVTWFPSMPEANEGTDLIRQFMSRDPQPVAAEQKFPRWLSFEVDGQIDLVSVPWAWWGGRREPDEVIRFVYDRLHPGRIDRQSSGRLTLGVQDRRWFGLLEFLASGHLNSAGKMMDEVLEKEDPDSLCNAKSALEGKVKGPLVAVAGTILLLARTETTDKLHWDTWLDNLSRLFPGIPDGAILLGCRRIQQASNRADLESAYQQLREGINRGVPFFSASIRLLSIALAQICDDIPAAAADRRAIASVATRIDPDQPFTIIRLSETSR